IVPPEVKDAWNAGRSQGSGRIARHQGRWAAPCAIKSPNLLWIKRIERFVWHFVCSLPHPLHGLGMRERTTKERATMNGLMRGLKGAVLLGAGVAITGCSNLGTLGNVLGGVLGPATGSGTSSVAGTVRYVDAQRQLLQ